MVSRSNWLRRTFKRFWRTPRRPYRRHPERSAELLIESLEDRTLLSAVVFMGRNLAWNGFSAMNGANTVQMSVNGAGMLILQDTSLENISLTNAPGDWTGNGTPTVMGLLSDVDAIMTDGTAPVNPADTFTLANGGGTVSLTGNFSVTGFNTVAVDTPVTAAAGLSVSLTANATTGTSTLGFGGGGTISADIQSYRAGLGTGGTTAAADLVTNTPTFLDATGTVAPTTFTYRQDAAIAAANFPAPSQFGGTLPTDYTIQSDGGSITTPTTAATGTNLNLLANGALTINDSLTLTSLTAHSGISGTGNLTFGTAGVTIAADTQSYQAGGGSGTTAVADLVTNSPTFMDTTNTVAPVTFTDRQDATITAATIADAPQFGASGALPTTYTIQSDQGSLTTPATTDVSSSTSLILNAPNGGVTIAWILTISALTVMAGGDISVTASVTASGTVALTTTGGMIGESGGGAITANQLTILSVTGINLTGNNAVANFQASNSGSNDITFRDTVSLAITGTGINQTGGNVMLTVPGSITVTGPIADGGHTVSLTATGTSGAVSGTGAITANQLTILSVTGINLTGNNAVANFQATNSTSGAIVFDDAAAPLTLGVITQIGGGDVTITNTGGDLNVNGKITMTGGTLQLTSHGMVNINAPIDPPAVVIIIAFSDANISMPVTATDRIAVFAGTGPTNTGNVNVLTGGSLTQNTAGRTGIELYTGTTAGSISLSGQVNAQDMVWLTATNDATEMTGGTITAPRLLLLGTGSGAFTLNQANAIGTSSTAGVLAGLLTGSVSFFNNPGLTTLTIGTLPRPQGGSNVLGLTSTSGDIALNLNNGLSPLVIGTASNGESITATAGTVDLFAGGVMENPNAIISAANLRLRSAGLGTFAFNLGNTNAVTGMLAGNFFGMLAFTNNAGVTVGTVTTAGLNSNGGNITLSLNGGLGLLTINTPAGPGIVATGATVDLFVGGINEASAGSIITANALRLRGTGTFNLNPTNPNVVATLAGSFTGALTFKDNSANPAGLTVGTVLGTSGLTSANNNITLCNSGDILINQPINAGTNAGAVTVRMKSGASVGQGTGVGAMGVITADNLGVDAVGGVSLDKFANSVSVFAARGSNIAIRFAGLFSLGTVAPANGSDCFNATITGIMTPGGPGQDVTICQDTGTLTLNMAIFAGGGTVRLVASNGGVTQTSGAAITAVTLGVMATSDASVVTGGGILLDLANNLVGTFAALNTSANPWPIRFLNTNGVGLVVGTVTAASPCFIQTAGVTNTHGDVTLNLNNGASPLTIGTPPTAGSGEGIFATQGTVELFSAGAVEVPGAAIMAARLLILSGAGGPFTFNLNQTNTVGTIAGRVSGDVGFTNSGVLTVATIMGVAGLTATGNISLALAAGTAPLTIGTPPTAGSGEGIFAGATVVLFAGGATESTGAAITAARLLLLTGPGGPFAFSLTQTNNSVGTIAGRSTGNISYTNASALIVGTILGTVGLITPGNITLVVGGGTLPLTLDTQPSTGGILGGSIVDIDAGGVNEISAGIQANSLRLRSAPGGPFPFALTDAQVNVVNVIAGDFYGPLTYATNAILPLAVDTVLGTAGLTSHGSGITLTLVWQLTVNQTINAGSTGNLNITAANTVTFNNDAQVTANAALLQKSSITSGINTIVVNYSGLVDTTWTITGSNAGTIGNSRFTITSSPQAIVFMNFQSLTGGAGADTFIFNDGATLGGSIDGGQGTVAGKFDTIDWSRYTTARMVRVLGPAAHGVFGSEPSVAGGFTDIDRLVGPNNGASTLIGPDHNNTWAITGMNSGTLTTDYGGGVMSQVSFAGFPNLKGGALIDNFVFQNGGQVTGTIDGGAVPAGLADTLDWSAVTTNRVVGIAGFGSLHGYAGSEAQSVNAFTNIDQLIGSATAMQNSLFGENQDRTWIVGVNGMGTNVQGVYGPASLSPALFFANFQTLVGGSGADTFFVNATPAGKAVTLFGGGGTNTFNVGGTVNSLDQLAGPLGIVGGGSPTTTPQSVSATVGCPPAPGQAANAHPAVTQMVNWVSGGNTVNIADVAGAAGVSGLTYGLGRSGFSRTAAGTMPVVVSYLSVETVNLVTSPNPAQVLNITDTAVIDAANPGTLIHPQTSVLVSGTGAKVNVFNTGDSSALLLSAPAATTAVGIFRTGVNSYTKLTVGGTIFQAGSGMASILDITGSGAQVNFLGGTPGTGPSSVTRVTMAGMINLQSADPTSGLSLMGGQVNVGLFNNPTASYPPHPFATAVVNVAGPGVLNFVNAANQPNAINTDEFRFVSGGATGNNLITSPDETAVYLCSGPGVTLPQATFVAATFLLPNQLDASGRPVATIVLVSQLARSFPIQNFSLPPVVAAPNFGSPFGFGPPSVTVADINGDGVPDLIVGAGQGYAPLVTVFDGRTVFNTLGAAPTVLAQFFAYDSRFVGGVYVAAGHIDPGLPPMANAIITGTGRGVFPVVEAFVLGGPSNPNAFPVGGVTMIRFFLPYQNTLGGVRVASGKFDNSGLDDIVTAPGPGDAPNVRVFSSTSSGNSVQLLRSFFAYNPAFVGGVDVAVGHLLGDAFDDIVTAPASAGSTQVNVFNGQTGVLQSSFSAFPGTFNGVGGLAVDASAGTPRIIVGSALGQPAQIKAFDVLGDPLVLTPNPFFDAAGNPTNNPALANHQGVAVGGRSR
jgi:hypothetical protein